MGTILEILGADHRACDDLFALAEEAAANNSWGSARELFGKYQAAMAHHLAMEENVLFPAFETRTGISGGPTQVMRMEHDQMRSLMEDMAAAAEAGDVSAYLGAAETLNMLTQQHKLKEENMLYPMADQTLGADREAVIHSMQAIGH